MKRKLFYNLKDLEKEMKINRRTLREYCKEGKLKAKKVGRTYLVTEKSVMDFVDAR